MKFMVFCVSLALCGCFLGEQGAHSAQNSYKLVSEVNWPEFMSQLDLQWDRIPPDWTESAFIGNGLHGATICRDVNGGLRWTVGRHDVIDKANRLEIGRFVLPPVDKPGEFRMRLDLWNAEVRGEWKGRSGTLWFKSFTHAKYPATVIVLDGNSEVCKAPIKFIQDPPITQRVLIKKFEAMGMKRQQWSRLKDEKALAEIENLARRTNPEAEYGATNGVNWCCQQFKRGGGYVVAWGDKILNNGKRLIVFTTDFVGAGKIRTGKAVGDVRKVLDGDFKDFVESHRQWWHRYYTRSFLSFPDARMASFYWIQMYKLGSATRADCPALDLQGPWTWRTPWSRIWWNLNLQLTYWPVYTANRLNIGESLVRMIDAGRQNLINNVPQKWRGDSAAIRRTSVWDCKGSVGKESGNLMFALHNYWLFCRYEWDDARLKNGLYPILKRAVGYYLHLLKEGPDSKLHTPKAISPEYPVEAEDTNYDLALLRWGLQTLLAINERLGLNDPMVPKWREVQQKLAPFNIDPDTGYMIGKGVKFDQGHRHFSHLFMVYPLHLVDPTDPAVQVLIKKSIDNWLSRGRLQGYSYTGGAAMRAWMGDGNEALRLLNMCLDKKVRPNTMYIEAGPVIETPLAAAASINEMFLQSWTVAPFGVDIRVFPAVPDKWQDASFRDLRAEGAFLVSAERRGGQTRWVYVKSLEGAPCRIRAGLKKPLRADGARKFTLRTEKVPSGELTVIDLKKGESVLLRGADSNDQKPLVRAVKLTGPLNFYGLH